MPTSATSQPVPVVPTLAPNTRPSPCGKVKSPALTRPIVVIVTALDDCTSRVTTAPQKAPESGVAAAWPRAVRRADPASALRPSVMTVMPSRNSPTPPRMAIVVDMLELVGDIAAVDPFVGCVKPLDPNGHRAHHERNRRKYWSTIRFFRNGCALHIFDFAHDLIRTAHTFGIMR